MSDLHQTAEILLNFKHSSKKRHDSGTFLRQHYSGEPRSKKRLFDANDVSSSSSGIEYSSTQSRDEEDNQEEEEMSDPTAEHDEDLLKQMSHSTGPHCSKLFDGSRDAA